METELRHEMDSGLGNEIQKLVPSNRAGNSLPGKEIVPSSLFFQENTLMKGNYLSKRPSPPSSKSQLEARRNKEIQI